jgi:Cu(I)/Ag(I) efflux system membrane fusion protein
VESRTNRVRVTLANPDMRLKPGMFATMFFDTELPRTLAIPLQAVLVTGERNLVFVRDEEGMLQPRDVVLGAQAGDYVQILSGLTAGETIVGSANFLVDAESRLASTGSGMPGMQHGAMEPDPPSTDAEGAMDSSGASMEEHPHD